MFDRIFEKLHKFLELIGDPDPVEFMKIIVLLALYFFALLAYLKLMDLFL